MSISDRLTKLAGRIAAEAAIARERVAGRRVVATPPALRTQSVDQLISILQGQLDATGIKRTLTDKEAKKELVGWQYASVEAIARAVMLAGWHVETLTADGWVEAPDHPLVKLLHDVNPFMVGEELILWTTVEMLCIGRSWVRKVRNSLGEVVELWPLLGSVQPIVDAKDGLVKWKETSGRGKVTIHDAKDIVYYRVPKIGDLWGGMGRVQAAGAAIRMDLQIDEAEWAAFKRGLWPNLVAYIAEPDADKRNKMLQELRERYSGSKESGGVIGLRKSESGDRPIELDALGMNRPRDMGFDAGSKRTRDQILSVIGTPLEILGHNAAASRASVEAIEYMWAKWGISPLVKLRQARENQDLASEWEDTRIVYENLVPADRALDIQQEETDLRNGVLTINEVRSRRGLESVPWGDRPIMPVSMLPLGEPAPDSGKGGQMLAVAPPPLRMAPQTRGGDAEVRKRFLIERIALERRIKPVIIKHFRDIRDEVLDAWDNARQSVRVPREVNEILTPERMARMLAERMQPVVRYGLVLGGEFERSWYAQPKDYPWGDGVAALERYAAQFDAHAYLDIASDTRKAFTESMAEGIKANETWDQMRARIVKTFGDMEESRVANIVTTETTKLYGAGAQGFRDEYKVPGKRWVCSFVNSRDTHIAADGQVVKNGEMFHVGADRMSFPGAGSLPEENCNCSCVAVGVLETK